MSIPIMNRQALGNVSLIPRQPLTRKLALRQMGQMGPTIPSEEINYREAVKNLDGVKKAYLSLVAMMGQDKADLSLQQAQAAVEAAQAKYVRTIPQK